VSIFNLTYATTRGMIKVLRPALAADPLFQPGGAGPSRAAETIVLDAWGYQVRDFPVVVITGVPGATRRMAFNDEVRPFFGVPLVEEPGGTATKRTFDVPVVLVVGSSIELRYAGANASTMQAPPPWGLGVQQKTVGSSVVNYIELNGNVVGPASTYPAKDFEASTEKYPTGQVYGGFYDMTVNVTTCARSTQTRELLADRLWSLVWFLKKKDLRKLGIVVLDVNFVGNNEADYGSDKLYQSKFAVKVATEFEAIAQFTEIVTDVSATGTAVSTLP